MSTHTHSHTYISSWVFLYSVCKERWSVSKVGLLTVSIYVFSNRSFSDSMRMIRQTKRDKAVWFDISEGRSPNSFKCVTNNQVSLIFWDKAGVDCIHVYNWRKCVNTLTAGLTFFEREHGEFSYQFRLLLMLTSSCEALLSVWTVFQLSSKDFSMWSDCGAKLIPQWKSRTWFGLHAFLLTAMKQKVLNKTHLGI